MGMGEPLLNYTNVVNALKILGHEHGFCYSPSRMTLSTVGYIPQLKKLAKEYPVRLAISLHAGNDELRSRLIPTNRLYPLQPLIACLKAYPIKSNEKITFEYTLMQGINDSIKDAHQVGKLLQVLPAKVNAIPYNPHAAANYQRPDDDRINAFRRVINSYGIHCLLRSTRGEDIDAACGQLGGVQPKFPLKPLAHQQAPIDQSSC